MPISKTIEFANNIYNYLIGITDSHLASFLTKWPTPPFNTRSVTPNSLPVLSYLPTLVTEANTDTERIVKIFQASAEHLRWGQTYSADDFGPLFLEKYGWTELIGLRGPIASQEMACGFLLLGPDIDYPRHSHEAEEIYLPLTSHTLWRQGDDDWVSRPGGVPIYHRAWLPHGMRTGAAPLLALYLWRGGPLAQKSRIE